MAKIFEIVKRLRAGEEVIVPSKYAFVVMDQIKVHEADIGYLPPISVVTKKGHAYMKLER